MKELHDKIQNLRNHMEDNSFFYKKGELSKMIIELNEIENLIDINPKDRLFTFDEVANIVYHSYDEIRTDYDDDGQKVMLSDLDDVKEITKHVIDTWDI